MYDGFEAAHALLGEATYRLAVLHSQRQTAAGTAAVGLQKSKRHFRIMCASYEKALGFAAERESGGAPSEASVPLPDFLTFWTNVFQKTVSLTDIATLQVRFRFPMTSVLP